MKLNSNQNRNKNSSQNTELYITDDKTNSFWDFLKISWQKQTQLLSGASVPPSHQAVSYYYPACHLLLSFCNCAERNGLYFAN